MPSILVTGANRGIGLEFCKQYLAAGWRVYACCRDWVGADELNRLAVSHAGLSVHALDLTDLTTIDRLSADLAAETIDVLVNNAGVYGDGKSNRFGSIDYARWADVMQVNVLAPVKLLEALRPQLQRGALRLAVAITSLMGSIADNGSGGSIMYRSSKAALNAAMKTLSLDLANEGIGILILHPGWVQTDMGGQNAPTPVKDSVAGLRNVIDAYQIGDSGRFLDFRGRELTW